MVLEEDTPPADAFESSSSDPFASSDPAQAQQDVVALHVDLANLPRPMPVFGPLLGFTRARQMQAIVRHVAATGSLVQRRLTEDEMAAVSYHTSKAISIASYGAPIGIAAGVYRSYTTRAQWRFPFYKPDLATFNPERLMGLPPPMARLWWQAMRYGAYASWSGALGVLLLATYASSVGAVGERQDPRMARVVTEIREKMRSGKDMRQITREAAEYTKQRVEKRQEEAAAGTGNDGWGGRQRGVFTPQQQQQLPPRDTASRETYGTNTYGNSGNDYFDDASPTAGSEPLDSPAASSSSGSAWDRIRKGQSRPPNAPSSPSAPNRNPSGRPSPQQQSQSSQGDKESAWSRARNANSPNATSDDPQQIQRKDEANSFSFSTQEEERQLAKEEAQKEFDARVERERRGEDFDESEGRGGGRWR